MTIAPRRNNQLSSNHQINKLAYGHTSPAGVCKRVEALEVSHDFKTVFAISSERKITMTRNIYQKLDNIQGVQECSIPCFRKILKISINNEPNYNTCNRMFDMCSSFYENFIYISLSIAM